MACDKGTHRPVSFSFNVNLGMVISNETPNRFRKALLILDERNALNI